MDAGRESVGLAIPFTAGVAAASYSLKTFCIGRSVIETAASVTVALTILLICALWYCINAGPSCMVHSRRAICSVIGKWLTASGGKAVLRMLLLTAGTATALINAIPHISAPETPGIAEICAVHLKSLIDSIPFADAGSNALVKAFLTGDQRDLGTGIIDAFRDSGASHLLALSGMHLSIIYLVVSRILSFLGNTRCVRICRSAVIVAGSAFFTVMTGAAPSLVRAFFFILLRECSLLTGRSRDSINIFCIALLIQLAITPSAVTSAGFQLSYLAMLGIFLLYRPLDSLWDRNGTGTPAGDTAGDETDDLISAYPDGYRHGIPAGNGSPMNTIRSIISGSMRYIWSMCALSIACQVFTAPAVLLYFGTFPQYFLITNLLCIPLSNIIMVLSIIILPLYAAGICPQFLIDADGLLLTALVDTLGTISAM